jgi:NADH-quinone oxidoreductase subunit G
LKSTPSISPFNAGGENIEIHHSEGRIYRIKPRYNKDANKWWISDETRYGFQFVHDANRLTTPQKMQAGAMSDISWEAAYRQVEETMRSTFTENGAGSVGAILSPFDSTEEMYLQIKYVRGIDPKAWLAIGPTRKDGEDRVFKNPATGQATFTLRAEKAPNRKGAEKLLAHFRDNVCSVEELAGKGVKAVVFSSDPQINAAHKPAEAPAGIPVVIRLGTKPVGGVEGGGQNVTVSLPTVTWAEKSGAYENADGLVQPFIAAIPPLDECRNAGQIFWDLLGWPGQYTAATVRAILGTSGMEEYDVVEPVTTVAVEDMQFAEL